MQPDKRKYAALLARKSPPSPLARDCLLAFVFGGAICTVGEGVRMFWLSRGLDTDGTAAATAITMVFLGALLTCLHLYDKLAKHAGAAVLGAEGGSSVRMTHVLFGKMIELGVKDANNMGAAMAPAACDTLSCLLRELGAQPTDFDCIVTGDLGRVGADLLLTLLREDGIDLSPVYSDCGILLFGDTQDAHAGGSGCGCSAAVLCGPLLRDMHEGKIRRMIFAGTGAMMSPTSVQQSQPIAGICHAVVLERSGA